MTTIGLFSILGKITLGPFVEEPDEDEDPIGIGESSSLFSNEPRYWSSANIPFPMDGSMLNVRIISLKMINQIQLKAKTIYTSLCSKYN